jgi:peptidoglycan/xylan/chitin deacetylase (PgdA/CDA1 family)
MCGTFGVIPGLVGTWAHGIRWYMNWDEIKEMSDNGMEIVSHTYTHPNLSRLNDNELKHELLDSKLEIEKQTGKSVETLFYPSGEYNSHVEDMAKQYGYKSARVNWGGIPANVTNMFSMPVIRINWGNSATSVGSEIKNISKQ